MTDVQQKFITNKGKYKTVVTKERSNVQTQKQWEGLEQSSQQGLECKSQVFNAITHSAKSSGGHASLLILGSRNFIH